MALLPRMAHLPQIPLRNETVVVYGFQVAKDLYCTYEASLMGDFQPNIDMISVNCLTFLGKK